MAKIYNSELTKNIVKSIRGQISREKMPDEIAEKVLPVIEVNPLPKREIVIKGTDLNNATSANIYTTPTNADFYITTAAFTWTKDATATATNFSLKVYVDGALVQLLSQRNLALSADSGAVSQVYMDPIKVDRGQNILITSSNNTGNFGVYCNITGFLVYD